MLRKIVIVMLCHAQNKSLAVKLHEFPFAFHLLEVHFRLHTIGHATDNKQLAVALRVLLSIDDVVNLALWNKSRFERRPLFGRNRTSDRTEIVVGVGSSELNEVVQALNLKRTV